MHRLAPLLSWIIILPASASGGDPVAAVVDSTLGTAGDRIRQYAFDGDDATSYATSATPGENDSVSLVFDEPVLVKSVEVRTGGPDGAGRLDVGSLEGSSDGKSFERLAGFGDGLAKAEPGRALRAIRVLPGKDAKGPLAVREIVVDSEPALKRFAYPVEVVVDEVDAPAMRGWAENAAKACERSYGLINEALRSDGFRAARVIRLSLKDGIDVPAFASGNRITGSVKWFQDHPDDVGAMIHETTHVVQRYRGRGNPGWLVEGVADYVRFILYEPQNIGGLNPRTARYDQSYRVTARFLDYINRKYDKEFVLKLNRAMRRGDYSDDLFKESTGKSKAELGEEWRATLQK
ncbi:basic secretory protein-like protein [Paludisphaera mucosa]|uniref:Basic secretory protein-like protein n=1 Tax=Paludisphaera mucosa TaxID=3030827 RepID=A0ABT6FA38_9BACT|nr:basic secretory protein-like protein [Paludisphaera mucosa]MDG3004456.1 basic secretory protein-like protein [Paludisphaera mucosa]